MLRSIVIAVSAIVTGLAAPAAAQSAFDGNWKANPSASKLDPRPDVYSLADGVYTCTLCTPAYTVPADGKYHAIPDHPYADETSITVVDANTLLQRDRKGGKVMDENTSTLSSDGNALTITWKDYSAPNGKMVTGSATQTRISPAAAGAHASSGSWRNAGVQSVSDEGVRFTVATHGDTFRYSDPTGTAFEGRYGGPYTPVVGDPAHTMAKIEKISANAVRETQMRNGKVTMVADISVSPDGRTLTNIVHDPIRNTTTTAYATKE